MCLDQPLWNRLDHNMAPLNYLESGHMALEILIWFPLIFEVFRIAYCTASPRKRHWKTVSVITLSGSFAFTRLFMEEIFNKKCHFYGNIFHHCHDTHLTLVHINADVSVHKLYCPQTDSELWMEVMVTIAVTSVLSGKKKHAAEPWKQHVTQKASTSKPAYTVIRIYWSLSEKVQDLLSLWIQSSAFH